MHLRLASLLWIPFGRHPKRCRRHRRRPVHCRPHRGHTDRGQRCRDPRPRSLHHRPATTLRLPRPTPGGELMPLESITCTSCGATDVQEVKADTYLCNHCEAVFKYVDPSKVTVTQEFCSCGNKVEAQCNLCHADICRACDVELLQRTMIVDVPTLHFGYVVPSSSRIRLVDGRIQASSRVASDNPIIPIGKIMEAIVVQFDGLRHLCWKCAVRYVPDAARMIADGELCEMPDCRHLADRSCICCSASFCNDHLGAGRRYRMGFWGYGPPRKGHQSKEFEIKWPTGLCGACDVDLMSRIRELVSATYSTIVTLERTVGLDIFVETKRVGFGQKKENERVLTMLTQCAADVSSSLEAMVRDSTCSKSQLAGYVVLDRRSDGIPSVASGVLGSL